MHLKGLNFYNTLISPLPLMGLGLTMILIIGLVKNDCFILAMLVRQINTTLAYRPQLPVWHIPSIYFIGRYMKWYLYPYSLLAGGLSTDSSWSVWAAIWGPCSKSALRWAGTYRPTGSRRTGNTGPPPWWTRRSRWACTAAGGARNPSTVHAELYRRGTRSTRPGRSTRPSRGARVFDQFGFCSGSTARGSCVSSTVPVKTHTHTIVRCRNRIKLLLRDHSISGGLDFRWQIT